MSKWLKDEYGYRRGDTIEIMSYTFAKQTADFFSVPLLYRSHYDDHVTDWMEVK